MSKYKFEAKKTFLVQETSRIEECAKRIGIVLPSNHTALFQSIYAPLDIPNDNGIALDAETVKQKLPEIIMSQANLNHLGHGFIVGVIADAWINSDTEEINIIYSFAKNIYQKEYIKALELMAENKLTVSFELSSDLDKAKQLGNRKLLLKDISWDGVGILLDKTPAYKNAKTYAYAERIIQSAKESEKELIFASQIIDDCEKILNEEGNMEYEAELLDIQFDAAKWTTKYINTLPNSSFAVVEPAYKDGKTDNKNARHLPFKDANGKIDLPHYRNALARANQILPVTDSISTEELRSKAINELNKHKDVLKTASEGEKIMELTEEQKKLISDLKAEFGDGVKDWKDEDFLNATKVEEYRASIKSSKEEVKADQQKLSKEVYMCTYTYDDQGNQIGNESSMEGTYTYVDSQGNKQTQTTKNNSVTMYSEKQVSEIKAELETVKAEKEILEAAMPPEVMKRMKELVKEGKAPKDAVKQAWDEYKKKNAELEVKVAEQDKSIAELKKENDTFKAAEQAKADKEKAEKLAALKTELKDNPYTKEFTDEDYFNAEKVQIAKDRQERDVLKAENDALKAKNPETQEKVTAEKKDLKTGHSEGKEEEKTIAGVFKTARNRKE